MLLGRCFWFLRFLASACSSLPALFLSWRCFHVHHRYPAASMLTPAVSPARSVQISQPAQRSANGGNRGILIRTLLLITLLFCATQAQAGEPGATIKSTAWLIYLEPFYGTAIIDRIRGSQIGTGQLIDGVIDGQLREGRLDDGVAGLGLRIERRLGAWHAGVDLAWRYRTDWDLTSRTPSIQSITNIFSDVETRSATVLLGRHWWFGKRRLSIDAGIGLVRNRIETEYLEREVPGVRQQLRFEAKETPRDLAWNLTLSWHRQMGERWLMGARYRYSNLGDFSTGDFGARPAEFSARHRSHDVVVSFGRRF